MPRTASVTPIKKLLVLSLLAIVLGVVTGVITRLFIVLLDAIQHFVWTYEPHALHLSSTHSAYTIIVCLIGGVLMGFGVKFLGNYPRNIKTELAEFQKTKRFDYKHIPHAFGNSLISLGFGAALGPEAALTTIIGGMCTWVTDRLKLALGITEKQSKKSSFANKLQFYIPVTIAFLVAYWVYRLTESGASYFDLQTIPYIFQAQDIIKSVLPIGFGVVIGIIFLKFSQLTQAGFQKIASVHIKAILGGLVLGVLAALWPLVLFSGHEGIQSIMSGYATISASLLLLSALAKVVTTNTLLGTGWKGGQFFPVMFAGGAIGLSLTHAIPAIPAMVGLVAAMTAMLSIVVGKPIIAGVLVAMFFPPNLYPIILVATIIPMLVMRIDSKRLKLIS
jgi:H+/Cl- antiporter ClcA